MKRTLMLLASALCALLLLTGCAGEEKPEMYIETAQLTETEEKIAKLLGANNDQLILDFKLDENVQSMHVMLYELKDGAWEDISGGGGMLMTDAQGRMALGFDVLPDGMRIAVQSGENSHSTTQTTSEPMDLTGMGRSTSRMSGRRTVEYEQECPVAIQIITSKNEVHSFLVDYFNQPEAYAEYGYEHVYALTVKFSQQPLQ